MAQLKLKFPMNFNVEVNRRNFVKASVASAILGVSGAHASTDENRGNGMIYRELGMASVSAIGLGGSHIGNPILESEGIAIVRAAIDRGITFMDNCWDYHAGQSEIRMGKGLQGTFANVTRFSNDQDRRTAKGRLPPRSIKACTPRPII